MSWVLAIAGFCALIILHEFGHFVAAKAVGMRVERFSLFFPPTLLKVRRGETEYAIGAIPAGGYVKITGMNPEEIASLEPGLATRAYYNQPPWKRVVVIMAGPSVNLLIAFAIFWGVLVAGNTDASVTITNVTNGDVQALVATPAVDAIVKGAPAAGALVPGDRILAVDGRRHLTVTQIAATISSHACAGVPINGCKASKPVALTVLRHGRVVNVSVVPRYDAAARRMHIGFYFGATAKAFGPLAAARASAHTMWSITVETLTGFVKALTNAHARHQISSIVGITQATQQAIGLGSGRALVILGFVSLVLAVINLFPFLPLDGGHVLWSVAEKVRGRRISTLAMWRFSSVGILLLVFLVVNGFSNDINRLSGSG
jgi:regulator of sigma E protease